MATAYGDAVPCAAPPGSWRRVDNLSVRTKFALVLGLVLVVACSSSGGGSPGLSFRTPTGAGRDECGPTADASSTPPSTPCRDSHGGRHDESEAIHPDEPRIR